MKLLTTWNTEYHWNAGIYAESRTCGGDFSSQCIENYCHSLDETQSLGVFIDPEVIQQVNGAIRLLFATRCGQHTRVISLLR